MEIKGTANCGIYELDGIGRCISKNILDGVCEFIFAYRGHYGDWENSIPAFFTFTDVEKSQAGTKLSAYLKKNKLGTVQVSKYKRNPNSGNNVRIWVWSPNNRALRAFAKKTLKMDVDTTED